MNASLRTLLSGVVDYAGLFPPAQLPLDQAIRNYARYRQEAEAWMLGRFVIPAARLSELAAFGDLFQSDSPSTFSTLGQGGERAVPFLRGMDEDRGAIQTFVEAHQGRVRVGALEVRVPHEMSLSAIGFGARMLSMVDVNAFVEGFPSEDWRSSLKQLVEAIAEGNALAQLLPDRPSGFKLCTGYKLRTGGLDASAFPSIEQVTFVLHACREAGVPLKFTAGLHHPIRRFDAGLQTHMHGFINVFVAGVLAHARHLQENALRAVIADEDASDFVFTDEGLRWRDVPASTAEIAAARRDFVTSFGSCSFDEPRDDLRALGWL